MTLTKEWLLKTIAELEEERDATPGAVNEDATNALAAMKLALASIEAEPDYMRYDCGCCGWETIEEWRENDVCPKCNHHPMGKTPLYTATPAPVSAPDELVGKSFEYIANKFQVSISEAQWILVGWSACRAATLQGTEPVSNRDELPDGWVACSERMPNDKDYVWCWGRVVGWTEDDGFEAYYDATRNKWWAVTMDGEEPVRKVTHWQPLPSPPDK